MADKELTYPERLEGILKAHYPAALAGDIQAAEICLRVIEMRGRLHGKF